MPIRADYFSEHRWNHMVLKALFIGSTLAPIQGLDERANPDLAQILFDYAHERWAAERTVTPELWRASARLPSAPMLADLGRVLGSGTTEGTRRGRLALSASRSEEAAAHSADRA